MRQAHFFRALLALFLCLCLCAGLLAGCSARTASSAPAPVSGAPQQAPARPSSSAQPQPSPAQWEIGHLFGEFSGCAVLYNPASGQYSLYQPQLCETRFSPYSTFKIISACMGLHNGILEDENSHMRYSGAQYPVPAWNADLSLQEAFQSSCVWYFRQVIDALGQERVAQELGGPFLRQLRCLRMGGQRHQPFTGPERVLAGGLPEDIPHRAGAGPGPDIRWRQQIQRAGGCHCKGHDAGGRNGWLGNLWKNRCGPEDEAWFTGFAQGGSQTLYFAFFLNGACAGSQPSGSAAKDIAFRALAQVPPA